jgi:threonine/homoserine/homoserine lactone efflux protein
MSALSELAAFLAVAAVVIVTPGQDTALTIRNTLLGRRRGGICTALGVAAGQAVWTAAAAAGVTAVLLASERAFSALRLAGAAYLVVLGATALVRALRGREPRPRAGPGGVEPAARAAFRQGLVSNLTNPKMAVFFTSLLPQFAADGRGSFLALLALGLLFCTLTLAWLSAYAVAVARAGDVLRRAPVRRALEAATGAVLVALGLGVATAER